MSRRYQIIYADRIILDLCGGTGEWSKPYREAGYDVRIITLPDYDVLDYSPPLHFYGALAALPCGCFSRVGARWWKQMDTSGKTLEAIRIFKRCLAICQLADVFWCLENPPGRHFKLMLDLPRPSWQFQPYHFGNPWGKQTYLWGKFTPPWATNIVKPEETIRMPSGHTVGRISRLPSNGPERARTPDGFARAFFEVNR